MINTSLFSAGALFYNGMISAAFRKCNPDRGKASGFAGCSECGFFSFCVTIDKAGGYA
jgi:hypothetical protein